MVFNSGIPAPFERADSAYAPPRDASNKVPRHCAPVYETVDFVTELQSSHPAQILHDYEPTTRPGSGSTSRHEFELGASLSSRLRAHCRNADFDEEEARLLVAFRAAQYRLAATTDAMFAVSRANARCSAQTRNNEAVVQLLRTSVQHDTTTTDLLDEVHQKLTWLSGQDRISYDTRLSAMLSDEATNGRKFVRIGFAAYDCEPSASSSAHAFVIKDSPSPCVLELEVEMHIWKSDEHWKGFIDYDATRFSQRSIIGLASVFSDSLCGGLDNADNPVTQLPLSSGPAISHDAHFAQIDSTDSTYSDSVHDIFWKQVAAGPDELAVKDATQVLTYAQLGHMSKIVSRWLSHRHYAEESVIAVLSPRSADSLIMYLGILGANHAYLPLDVKSPADRLNSMLSSPGIQPLVLYSEALKHSASLLTGIECISLAQVLQEGVRLTPMDLTLPLSSSLAAIIFTSGSTGVPKGVMIEHRSIVRVAREEAYRPLESEEQTVVAHLLNPAFDAAMMEIYCALLNGAALYCLDESTILDSRALQDAFQREHVKMAVFGPALLKHCLCETPELFASLEVLVVGGERFKTSVAHEAKRFVRGHVFNGYGPTENTVVSTLYRVSSHDELPSGDIPIGQSVSGSLAFVMDANQRLVPPGVIGELVVAGIGLARGYLDSRLNADRFVHVILDGRSLRAYRTGDLARRRPSDLQLEFMGRVNNDQQVKIRGHRVELAEIDQTLRRYDAVFDSTTIAFSGSDRSDVQLVSFVTQASKGATGNEYIDGRIVPASGASSHAGLLRADLEASICSKLPTYMTPAAIVVLERMPLTNNGKIDSKALAQLASIELSAMEHCKERSLTEKETRLQQFWAYALSISPSSIHENDHFMRKGGDSLKAMRLIAEARRNGFHISIVDIMTSPRLCDMARALQSEDSGLSSSLIEDDHSSIRPFELLAATDPAEARSIAALQCQLSERSIEDIMPCTPLQAGLVALNMATPTDYVSRIVKNLRSDVDVDLFRESFDSVVHAHPILRTRIVDLPREGLVQVITSEPIVWKIEDSFTQYMHRDRQDHMDLGKPLIRVALIRDGARTAFVWTMHHALYDGWSMGKLLEALQRAYDGLPVPAPPPYQAFVRSVTSKDTTQAAHRAWRDDLAEHEADQFPRLPAPEYKPRVDSTVTQVIEGIIGPAVEVTAAVAVRAAFGIAVCLRESAQDIIFGTTVHGRHGVPLPGIEDMTGPTIATVPTRMKLSRHPDESLGQLLVRLQTEWTRLTPYEHIGLQHIRELSADAARAVMFQTLLVVQPTDDAQESNAHQSLFEADQTELATTKAASGILNTYAMVVEFQLRRTGVDIRVMFDSNVMAEGEVRRLFSQYESILRGLCKPEICAKPLTEIEWLSEQDIHDIWTWNETMPNTVDIAVHDLLASSFVAQPEAEAIRAWDGSFTYEMLDLISTQLAHTLLEKDFIGMAPIPILFQKSKWVSVAMLAVMKAGGTSVLLDAALPEARLQDMVDQLHGQIMLVSLEHRPLAESLFGGDLIIVDAAHAEEWATVLPAKSFPAVSPDTPLYIVFTSGSTGKPKGCVISHQSFSSALVHQRPRRSVTSQSRVFDFSSLAFDGTWFNLLHTLYAGGTLCVPSESGRKDNLKGSILDLGANFAFLTPSIAETLDAEALDALVSLEIGGEAMDPEVMRRIEQHTHVRYIYGPSECTPICCLTELGSHPSSLGRASGVLTWLVDPQHPDHLASVGSLAELWLEGPLLGSGYFNDPTRTADAFVINPGWMTRDRRDRPGRKGRAYRTGDLVRYRDDGSLTFIGRASTQQVKIRGQRVELGDVQHHVQHFLSKIDPGVHVIAAIEDGKDKMLVAFVCSATTSWTDASFEDQMDRLRQMKKGIRQHLARAVPSYMIPALYVPVKQIPLTVSGKLDRRSLQDVLSGLNTHQRKMCLMDSEHGSPSLQSEPATQAERTLLELCTTVLSTKAGKITMDDNFFDRGGDSISAMRLINAARRHQIILTIRDIWGYPRIRDLAARITPQLGQAPGDDQDADAELKNPAPDNVVPSSVALPVTCSQQQFLTGMTGGHADHIVHLLIEVPTTSDVKHIRQSCVKLFQHFDILRARFVCTSQRAWQIMEAADYPLPWDEVQTNMEDLKTLTMQICREDRAACRTPFPDPDACATRFTLIYNSNDHSVSRLILRLSHLQYDGISLPLILSTFAAFLKFDHASPTVVPTPSAQYIDYIRHVSSQNSKAYQYWRKLLHDSEGPTIVPPCHELQTGRISSTTYDQPTPSGSPVVDLPQRIRVSKTFQETSIPGLRNGEDTTASMTAAQPTTPAVRFLAACAATLATLAHRTDVVFGCIVSGRSSLPKSLQQVCGPCLNEIAVRARFPDSEANQDPAQDGNIERRRQLPCSVYAQLQDQMLTSLAYDTVAFDEVAAHCTSWPTETEDFGFTAHYQNTASSSFGQDAHTTAESLQWQVYDADRTEIGLPVPKADYIEVEATPMPEGRVEICVMGKSTLYSRDFLEMLLEMVGGMLEAEGECCE
ncbi:putative AMP-dependent synthetase/ligase, Condensation domain, phosphopantetheine binding ACP [Septoria linicola]|nr:putative AMP-dependent synthetase/ligase, Condensation domain, phosphopantetheine binding ACP [Septoria linicola]